MAEQEETAAQLTERIERAVGIAIECAGYDGGHHKQWVIDQMIRELLGDEYTSFAEGYQEGAEEPWDTGIAP